MDKAGSVRTWKPDLYDLLMRLPLILIFSFLALVRIIHLHMSLGSWTAWDPALALNLATDMAILLFLVLTVILTTIRLKPQHRSISLAPRLAAVIGSFLSMVLVALPPAELSFAVQASATIIILIGSALSFYTLSWLGRAFSILPEARTLVTSGPYAIVRHPLYLCEEIITLGAALTVISWQAAMIVAIQWAFQLWRMRNEERVLTAAFPTQYPEYARRVSRLIPTFNAGSKPG